MLFTHKITPALLFGSFLYRGDLYNESDLVNRFENHFGTTFSYRPDFNPLENYYAKEMGSDHLKRFFVITQKSYERDALVPAKLLAMEWEREWSVDGQRRVNVDIGLLSAENFVLATTKNYSHRVYLAKNIFSDLTYYFHQSKIRALPWTYPDYLDPHKMELFNWFRCYLLQQTGQ